MNASQRCLPKRPDGVTSICFIGCVFLLIAFQWTAPWLERGHAQSPPPLTLPHVLRAVEHTHPDLDVALYKIRKAEAKALSAQGGFDPTLNVAGKWAPVGFYKTRDVDAVLKQATPLWGTELYAGWRYGRGNFPVYKGDLETLSAGELRAGVAVPVWRDGLIDRRRADTRQTRMSVKANRFMRQAKRLSLFQGAAKAYWKWVAQGLMLSIQRQLLEIAETRNRGLSKQVEAGSQASIVLVDNERTVLQRRARVMAAERGFQQATYMLSLYLRDGKKRLVRPGEMRLPERIQKGRPVAEPVKTLVQRAFKTRPELKVIRLQQDIAQVERDFAHNQVAPKLSVHAFASRDLGDGSESLEPTEFGVGAKFEMPLLLRKERGALQAADAELASLKAALRGVRNAIETEVRDAVSALKLASQRVGVAHTQEQLAKRLAEAERQRFKEGVSTLVIVNLREIAEANAAVLRVQALAESHQAYADLQAATGQLTLDSLSSRQNQ